MVDTVGAELVYELEIIVIELFCLDVSTCSDCNFVPTLSDVTGCLPHSSLHTKFERKPSAPTCLPAHQI